MMRASEKMNCTISSESARKIQTIFMSVCLNFVIHHTVTTVRCDFTLLLLHRNHGAIIAQSSHAISHDIAAIDDAAAHSKPKVM